MAHPTERGVTSPMGSERDGVADWGREDDSPSKAVNPINSFLGPFHRDRSSMCRNEEVILALGALELRRVSDGNPELVDKSPR